MQLAATIEFDITKMTEEYGSDFLDNYDIAVSFKSAKKFSIYEWDAGELESNSIIWDTLGTATNPRNGQGKALSHASIYVRYDSMINPPPAKVPEPTSVLALGLIGGGVLLSRRRQQV